MQTLGLFLRVRGEGGFMVFMVFMVFYGFFSFFMVFIFFRLNAASAMNSRKEFSRLCFSRRLRKTPTAASAKGTNTKIILKLY